MSFNGDDNIATVTIKEARDIPAADPSGFSDSYTKVSIVPAGRKEYKTKVFVSLVSCEIPYCESYSKGSHGNGKFCTRSAADLID